MLAALALVTRPENEIKDIDEALEWVGMPEFERAPLPLQMIISFRNREDRARFVEILGLEVTDKTISSWYPPKERDDLSSMRFEG